MQTHNLNFHSYKWLWSSLNSVVYIMTSCLHTSGSSQTNYFPSILVNLRNIAHVSKASCGCQAPVYITTYVAPWSRVLPEKLTVPHLIEEFLAFYGTRQFVAVRARQLSLPCVRSDQSTPSLRILLSIQRTNWAISLSFMINILPSNKWTKNLLGPQPW
jgi:hypothetical protein